MSKLRDAALDQTCMYAYLGFVIQSRDRGARALPQSTGIGQKSLDICGAWTCNTCHSAVDSLIDTGFSRDELRLMHTEEAFRTISELH